MPRGLPLWLCLLAALALAAPCPAADAPAADPTKVFDYQPAPIDAKMAKTEDHPGYEVYRVSFPSYDRDDVLNLETVAWWYRQKSVHPIAGIVQIPILGGDYEPERLFSRMYAEAGFHVLFIERKAQLFCVAEKFDRTRRVMIDTIIDMRRCLDWWTTQPGIDARRLGVSGISMGGHLGGILTAVDRRVTAAVFMLSGGDFPKMLLVSQEPEIIALRENMKKMHGWTDQQLLDEANRMIGGVDPLALAARLDPKRILHVSPWFDAVVPYDLATEWWKAAGQPRRISIPTGHYSSAFFAFYIHRKCVEHFRAMFGYPAL